MTLDIRPSRSDKSYDLYEGDERIGEIRYVPSEVVDGQVIPEGWDVELWSLMGTGKTWTAMADTVEEATEEALLCHKELVGERRELSKGSRPPTISTPMGGQKRR